MDLAEQLLKAAGAVAPGFVAMKLIYVFGAQRQRAQWEWTVWSVGISLPIAWITLRIAPTASRLLGLGSEAAYVLISMGLAVALAVVVSALWILVERSDRDSLVWLRRALTDSAYDEVMDDSVIHQRWLEVVVDGTDREVSYVGWLATAGREDNKAEPWVFLKSVRHRTTEGADYTLIPNTNGLLFHRDRIQRIRVLSAAGEGEANAPTDQVTIADQGADVA